MQTKGRTIEGGGGGGLEDSDCARIIFPLRGIRQIFFSCKSAAQDIFFPIYFAAGYFVLSLIITAYSIKLKAFI